ncbi:E3 ubiquitin-protein ligase RSL1-like [Euphorbia lathyris]|uniref:E3 ubiquitin-protein ligase RSL1-like n=1 Tax=Euphorbia lathyris TaxID=212925 RepID=UPI0033131E9A
MDTKNKGKTPITYHLPEIPPTSPLSNDHSFHALLDDQRHEIAAAKALQSDDDFAYKLQMEEAIAASLSIPYSPSKNDTVSYVPDNDSDFDYLGLLLDDIERLDQERRDRESCEGLMMEMRNDLDRRIHDQKLASEILTISDADWAKDGDYYHKPYGGSSSSSCSSLSGELALVSNECFKVYCKGLESEEMIKDMKVAVGGVGVAICDSRDNVIFEVAKNLEVGAGKNSEHFLQIRALVEGLNAAVSLDLKRITLFCDDFMVYQYVTGRVQLMENRVSTLVNEVSLLQKKFTDCKPVLVARTDVKFAYKLARDAIVSQITWPAESSQGKTYLRETCAICYNDTNVDQMFSVDGCLHRYCFACMKQHVEVKVLNGMQASCPHEGCKSEVSIDKCGKFLDPKLVEIMSQRKKEASLSVTEKVYCPYTRCSALMSKSEVLEYTKAFYVGAEQSGARKCMKCYQFFCLNCKVAWHYNMTCHDYKRRYPHAHTEDSMLDSLAKTKRWRQCVMCKHMVELAEGCYHITCRCGYEFCYTCGAPWKNKKPTCNCKLWDERNIIRNDRRR